MFKADTTTVTFLGDRAKESEARSSAPAEELITRGRRAPVERSDEDVDSSVGLRFSSWYVYRANLPWSGSLPLRKTKQNKTQLFGISKNILYNKNLLILIFLLAFGQQWLIWFFFFFRKLDFTVFLALQSNSKLSLCCFHGVCWHFWHF